MSGHLQARLGYPQVPKADVRHCKPNHKIPLHLIKYMKRLDLVAGAPGFEPGNGGIKIRCLTTWLRPNRYRRAAYRPFRVRRRDHTDADRPDQRPPPHINIYRKRALTGLEPRLD